MQVEIGDVRFSNLGSYPTDGKNWGVEGWEDRRVDITDYFRIDEIARLRMLYNA